MAEWRSLVVAGILVVAGCNPFAPSTVTPSGSDSPAAPGSAAGSSPSPAASPATPTLQPTGLTTANVTQVSFVLSWNAAPGAVSYTIVRNGTTVATGITGTSYGVTGLIPGTTYAVTVAGVGPGGASQVSAPLSVNTLPF